MTIRVTIGLCVKNSEKTITDCINSILTQRYPSKLVQLIIVDGRSKDKTMSIIADAILAKGIEVETYSDEGRGIASARQIVVTNATGKYIIFVDSDAILVDNFVSEQVSFMEANPKVGIAFARPLVHQGTRASTIVALFYFAEGSARGSTATIFKTELVRRAGGFDVTNNGAAEDIDLITKIQVNGALAITNERARFYHKYRDSLIEYLHEQSWFGYGSHYINHKNKNLEPAWRSLPFGYLFYAIKNSNKAYRLTVRKISFLIPFHMVLGNIFWWFGFLKSHLNGYGH
jgi:glycosyltransferase involved in cell wall biosynthesis